ncbi:uncharacterized protein LOC144861711 [Branchiostoma floridae x Branchiostoma japonicum]
MASKSTYCRKKPTKPLLCRVCGVDQRAGGKKVEHSSRLFSATQSKEAPATTLKRILGVDIIESKDLSSSVCQTCTKDISLAGTWHENAPTCTANIEKWRVVFSAQAASSAQGTQPSAQGTLPSAQGTLPSAQGTQPSAQGTLPSAQGTQPSAQGTLPSAQGTLPSAQGSQPSAQATQKTPLNTPGKQKPDHRSEKKSVRKKTFKRYLPPTPGKIGKYSPARKQPRVRAKTRENIPPLRETASANATKLQVHLQYPSDKRARVVDLTGIETMTQQVAEKRWSAAATSALKHKEFSAALKEKVG